MTNLVQTVKASIDNSEWPGYVHTYPHKRAYRIITKEDILHAWKGVKDKLNIYIHVPFCRRKCAYCNLFSTVQTQEVFLEKYVEKVVRDMVEYKKLIPNDVSIASIYFGGGTPTVLSINMLNKLLGKIHELFPVWDKEIEPCIECSPDDLSDSYIRQLKEIGFRRISVGVQSLIPDELNIVNRRIGVDNIPAISNLAKSIGMNVNFDLIYGLPGQDREMALGNLKKVVELQPDTITIYPLAIRKLTGMDNLKIYQMMNMSEKYALFDEIRTVLEAENYHCQTVVRFVRGAYSTYQQQRCEYSGVPTLGLGAGARSYTDDLHYSLDYMVEDKLIRNTIDEYINCEFLEGDYIGFFFTEDERMRKMVMLTLLDPCISIMDFEKRFGENILDKFGKELNALLLNKLIIIQEDKIYLTRKGRKYSDIVASVFESEKVKELYSSYEIK